MTSLLKKLSIPIKIGVIKRYGVWSVSKLSTESVGSRRELVANSVHTADADADATKQFRRVGVGQACRGYGYPWIYPCVDMRLRPPCGYIHGYYAGTLAN